MAEYPAALRALIAAIPHIGGSIDALVTDPVTKAAERRLQFMFVELHRRMRDVQESDVRSDFLETAEWAELVRRSCARATQTRDCWRLSAIARILAAAATGTVSLTVHAPAVMDILAHTRDEETLYC